jgi:hypothetical protein
LRGGVTSRLGSLRQPTGVSNVPVLLGLCKSFLRKIILSSLLTPRLIFPGFAVQPGVICTFEGIKDYPSPLNISPRFSNDRQLAEESGTPYSEHSMPQEHSPDRRTAVRYNLRLPVIFHWNDGGTDRTEGGFTCDVAVDGALIFSSKCPPVGANVRIEILIPSPDESNEELRIECIGKVTRVWEQPGSSYFGVHGLFNDNQLTRHDIWSHCWLH